MQFEVEEDLLALGDQTPSEIESAHKCEFEADLVEADRGPKAINHRLRVFHGGQVQGDDEAAIGHRSLVAMRAAVPR